MYQLLLLRHCNTAPHPKWTEDSNNEEIMPGISHTNNTTQLRHAVIPDIIPIHTPDVTTTSTTPTHTTPVQTHANIDDPYQITNSTPPSFPDVRPIIGDQHNTLPTAVLHTNHLKSAPLTLEAPPPLRSHKTRYQLRDITAPKTHQDYLMLHQNKKPTVAKYIHDKSN